MFAVDSLEHLQHRFTLFFILFSLSVSTFTFRNIISRNNIQAPGSKWVCGSVIAFRKPKTVPIGCFTILELRPSLKTLSITMTSTE